MTLQKNAANEQEQKKLAWKQQEGPCLTEKMQQRLFPPSDFFSGHSVEDEWISRKSPRPEVPELSTAQPALHSSAAASAGPSMSERLIMQGIPGYPLASSSLSPATADTEASGDEADTALATGAAAATAAAALEQPNDRLSFDASAEHEEAKSETTGSSTSLTGDSSEGARAAIAGTKANSAAGSALPASISAPAVKELPGAPDGTLAAVMECPFARLPEPMREATPVSHIIDLRRALTSGPSTQNPVPLQNAHELLPQTVLFSPQME